MGSRSGLNWLQDSGFFPCFDSARATGYLDNTHLSARPNVLYCSCFSSLAWRSILALASISANLPLEFNFRIPALFEIPRS